MIASVIIIGKDKFNIGIIESFNHGIMQFLKYWWNT